MAMQQEPIEDGGTDSIYKAYIYYIYIYIRPKFQGISPEHMAKNMVRLRTSNESWRSPIDPSFADLRTSLVNTCHGSVDEFWLGRG